MTISEASGVESYVGIREIELLSPFDFNNSSALSISENQPVGSVVGKIQTSPPNFGIPVNYSIPQLLMNHCEVGGNLMKRAEPQPTIRVVTASTPVSKTVPGALTTE